MGSSRVTSPVSQTRLRCECGAKDVRRNRCSMPICAQHLHRVRHHLDAGADARKAPGLLVDLHVHAEMAQRGGSGETAHAGADDGNGEFLLSVHR